MALQDRLEALAALGYTVGPGAVGDFGQPLSFSIIGFGISTQIPADDVDDLLATIEATHEERAIRAAKTPEELEAEDEAERDELNAEQQARQTARQARYDALVAKINASNLPAGVKEVLSDLAEMRLHIG